MSSVGREGLQTSSHIAIQTRPLTWQTGNWSLSSSPCYTMTWELVTILIPMLYHDLGGNWSLSSFPCYIVPWELVIVAWELFTILIPRLHHSLATVHYSHSHARAWSGDQSPSSFPGYIGAWELLPYMTMALFKAIAQLTATMDSSEFSVVSSNIALYQL